MEYIVSARKYRPGTFSSVEGQENITQTLKNAIKNKQLAHAYLFCGPRGVGKTTCARIFAKTINCENLGPDFEACNECTSCKAFNENRSYNIHELDAASNNSVDDIRLLIDKVRVAPQMGRYSVYIIDEVHMLSSSAFNAFLKTLEEPPVHAIFILATTEKHKILPTILSRCQTFDFNRITVEVASKYLRLVAQKEGVEIEDEALNVIATKADGAMRDALSIFDQIVAFCGRNITYQQVITNLNVLDYDYYFRLVDAFLKEDTTSALLIFNEILNRGFDGSHFISGLSSHLRDLMMCRDPQTVALLEVGSTIKQKYLDQAKNCSNDFLYEALKLCNECEMNYRLARNKRLQVEFTLLSLSRILSEKKKASELAKKAAAQASAGASAPANPSSSGATTQPGSVPGGGISKPSADSGIPSRRGISAPSLKVLLKNPEATSQSGKQAEQTSQDRSASSANKSVDPENLQKVWDEYAAIVKSENTRLSIILSNYKPTLKGPNIISLQLSAPIQAEEIMNSKQDLMAYLREKLSNETLELTVVVNMEEKSTQKQAFTASEKLKIMMEKNPSLSLLTQKFNLDLE